MSRPMGSTNRNRQFLMKRLKEMLGDEFDPVIKMAENAAMMQNEGVKAIQLYQEKKDPSKDELAELFNILANCITAWDKIANYTNPKMRHIEFSNELGLLKADQITDDMSAQEAANAYQQEILAQG